MPPQGSPGGKNMAIQLNENGAYNNKNVVLTDTLPEGFKLYTVANKTSVVRLTP